MELIQKLIKNNTPVTTVLGNLSNSLLYNYTEKKSEAITLHKQALDVNMNISTLVDMDYDIKNGASRVAKGSPERILRIHTTTPSCTLLTHIFVKEKVFDQDIFNKSMRIFPSLSQLTDAEFLALKESATSKTWNRFEKAIGEARVKSLENDFRKRKFPTPINDHSLVETLMEKIYGYENLELNFKKSKLLSDKQKNEKAFIEEEMKNFFLKQPEKLLVLLTPIFKELEENYILN